MPRLKSEERLDAEPALAQLNFVVQSLPELFSQGAIPLVLEVRPARASPAALLPLTRLAQFMGLLAARTAASGEAVAQVLASAASSECLCDPAAQCRLLKMLAYYVRCLGTKEGGASAHLDVISAVAVRAYPPDPPDRRASHRRPRPERAAPVGRQGSPPGAQGGVPRVRLQRLCRARLWRCVIGVSGRERPSRLLRLAGHVASGTRAASEAQRCPGHRPLTSARSPCHRVRVRSCARSCPNPWPCGSGSLPAPPSRPTSSCRASRCGREHPSARARSHAARAAPDPHTHTRLAPSS